MLITGKELVVDAQKKGYAVPSINTQGGNYDIIRSCVEAAEEKKSPIILAMYAGNIHYYGIEMFANISRFFGKRSSIPVAIHLDHGDSFDSCVKAIYNRFTSVMLDCSRDSIDENIKKTGRVIDCAHSVNVSVEAEVGELQRFDENNTVMENKNLANTGDVRKFVDKCQPDMLAVGIGNAHGFYKGKPNIRLDILKDIRKVTDIPLVLHGCTGMENEVIREAIKIGITKINFGTLVRYKYMEFYSKGIKELDHNHHSWMVARYAGNELKKVIGDIIVLSGSNNRV